MEKKHFSSYAERVRSAKEQAKNAQKKERKRKFTPAQWVTFLLMVVWTIASIFGVWGFSRTFDSRGNKMKVIGASAAGLNEDNEIFQGKYIFNLQGIQGLRVVTTNNTTQLLYTPLYLSYNVGESFTTFTLISWSGGYISNTVLPFNDLVGTSKNLPFLAGYSLASTSNSFLITSNIDDEEQRSFIPNGFYPVTATYYWNGGQLSSPLVSQPIFSIRVEFQDGNGGALDHYIHLNWTANSAVYSAALPYFYWVWRGSTTLTANEYDPFNTISNEAITLATYADFIENFRRGELSGRGSAQDIISSQQSTINRLEIEKQNAFENGRDVGYQEGLNAENPYTFGNLLSSVIDVPINAFKSLLNFELLGVNLLSFAEGLITIALLLALVKLLI